MGKFGLIGVLLIIWGANSIYGVDTVFTVNILHKEYAMPLPEVGIVAGCILLALPFMEQISGVIRRIGNLGVTSLGTGEIEEKGKENGDEGDKKRDKVSKLLKKLLG